MTCTAITGVTPEILLLRPEERYGEVLVRLRSLDVENFTTADYGALGYYIGKVAGTRNVALDGIPGRPSLEKLKFLLSPQPVSGAVSLCHIVGVTPEAPTLEEALGHRKPVEEITVGKREVRQVYDTLNTARSNEVDVVYFGCPHCAIAEMQEIAKLVGGKKKAERVKLWVSTNESMYVIAKRMGLVDIIEEAGCLVVTDLCMMVFPFGFLEDPVQNVASNSARAIHYQRTGGLAIAGAIAVGTFYGSTEQCIDAAITGRWGG